MLCATTTGARPVTLEMFRTAASISGTYSSMEPNTGSRLIAVKGTPRSRSWHISGFQSPRLHT